MSAADDWKVYEAVKAQLETMNPPPKYAMPSMPTTKQYAYRLAAERLVEQIGFSLGRARRLQEVLAGISTETPVAVSMAIGFAVEKEQR